MLERGLKASERFKRVFLAQQFNWTLEVKA